MAGTVVAIWIISILINVTLYSLGLGESNEKT